MTFLILLAVLIGLAAIIYWIYRSRLPKWAKIPLIALPTLILLSAIVVIVQAFRPT